MSEQPDVGELFGDAWRGTNPRKRKVEQWRQALAEVLEVPDHYVRSWPSSDTGQSVRCVLNVLGRSVKVDVVDVSDRFVHCTVVGDPRERQIHLDQFDDTQHNRAALFLCIINAHEDMP